MAILNLIHGYIGFGKTTFAKKLETETGAVRFTTDEWIVKLLGDNPPPDLFAKGEAEAKSLILAKAKELMVSGQDIILDFGLWTRKERDALREIAQSHGAEVRLYSIVTDMNVAKQRALARTDEMPDGALFIDEVAFEMLKSKFEPLDDDEAHIVVTSEDKLTQ